MDFGSLVKKTITDICMFTVDMTRQNSFYLSFIRENDESTLQSILIDIVPAGALIFAESDTDTDPRTFFDDNQFASETPASKRQGKPSMFRELKVRFSGTGGNIGLINFELPQATAV